MKFSKIICIGRNYAAHIAELNNKKPSNPFFFLKPDSSVLLPNSGPILIPSGVKVHYEVELGLVVGTKLQNLPENFTKQQAVDAIQGYVLAIDCTARNVQDEAKKNGLPWSIAKGFDTFCPVSHYIPKELIKDPENVTLHLEINDKVRQFDKTNLMLFPINKILSTISSIMTLNPGDLVLTGTPKGVGEILVGDHITGGIIGEDNKEIEQAKLDLMVAQKPGPYQFKSTYQ